MRRPGLGLAAACLIAAAAAARAQEQIQIRQVTPRVLASLDWPDGHAMGNAAAILTDEGVVLVDAHLDDRIGGLLKRVSELTRQPVRYLVHTHSHHDHAGGARHLPPEVTLIAHPVCRAKLEKSRPGGAEGLRLPTLTVETRLVLHLKPLAIHVLHPGPAHTYGDLVVWVPQEKVLVTGDLFFNGMMGAMEPGHIGSWVKGLDSLLALEAEHVIPGHGHLSNRAGLLTYRNFLADFLADVRAKAEGGESLETLIKSYQLPPRWRHLKERGHLHGNLMQAFAEVHEERKRR